MIGQPKELSRFASSVIDRQHISQGVTHVGHRNALLFVESRLKREQGQDSGDGRTDLVNSLSPPRPDRRTDIMDRCNTASFERFLKTKIEVRCINADEHVRRIGEQAALQLAAYTRYLAIVLEYLDVPANSQAFERIPCIETTPGHLGPANTEKLGIRQSRLERFDQMTRQKISRRFARHHGDANHPGSHRIMPRLETARKSRIG